MTSRRVLKVAEAIREVVSMAILTQLRDPRVSDVTVTYVEAAPDLRSAKIHVSVMGDEKKQQLCLQGLKHAAGFLQAKVNDRIETRFTPKLQFKLDQGVKNALKVAQILEEVLPPADEEVPLDESEAPPPTRKPTEFGCPRPEPLHPLSNGLGAGAERRRTCRQLAWVAALPPGELSPRKLGSWVPAVNPWIPDETGSLKPEPSFISRPFFPDVSDNTSMTTPNRAQILNTAYDVLKKHYQPVQLPADRTVLENLIYGICLENAPYDKADEVFARLQESFYDWNEVRVTTVTELSEVCRALPNPQATAGNLRRSLHSIFEAQFSFDLDPLKKENIGKAVKQLEKHQGVTPFAVAHVIQHGLGGHAIPVDDGLVQTMLVLGVITQAEADKNTVPGLERAIPKSKGCEFASLIHQLAAEFYASPRAPHPRAILLEIAPDAKDRFPKRSAPKIDEASDTPAETESRPKKAPSSAPKQPAAKAAPKKSGKADPAGKEEAVARERHKKGTRGQKEIIHPATDQAEAALRARFLVPPFASSAETSR